MTYTNSLSGQSWSAFSHEEQLQDYRSQLNELIRKLDSIVNVHTAHRLEEVVEAIGRLAPSFQPIIPPLPTDIFTGRDDYLKKLEEGFELSGTAARKEKRRVFVLYGSGGMGKTQLALKFADLHRER